METQRILTDSTLNKTEKIRQLLALGLTRRQVADLTGGNYGFVQNVFARYYPEQVRSRTQTAQTLADAFAFIPFNRRFGIEIEAYNVNKTALANALRSAGIQVGVESYNHTTGRNWKIVSDGSLQGNETFEIVSPILEGMDGLEQVKTVCRVLREKNAYINRSCGLHVHFDAERINLAQTKNLLINYSRYEAIIDSFMPNSRRANNNGYCRTLRDQESRIDSATSIERIANGPMTSRYFKVNMQAYLRHKTIEFRQHSGTIEADKIVNWVLFLHNLTEFSRVKRIDAPAATFDSLREFQPAEVITYLNNRISELAA